MTFPRIWIAWLLALVFGFAAPAQAMRGLTGLGTPLGAKSHCVNNPINLTDPDGLQPPALRTIPRYPSRTFRNRPCPTRGTTGRGSAPAPIPEPDILETTAEFEAAKTEARLPSTPAFTPYTRSSNSGLTDAQWSQYQQDLALAHRLYPSKRDKIEMHHPLPKYMGGNPIQNLIPLDAAYHQLITNRFRTERGYGKQAEPLTYERALEISNTVYGRYPLITPDALPPGPRIGPR